MKKKLTRHEEESRRDQIKRGMKSGSIKSSIDKGAAKISGPVAAPFKNLLRKVNVDNPVADTAVEAFVSSATMYGLAEILAVSGSFTEKIPGLKALDKDKMDQLGRLLRGYAGEKLGTQTADGAFALAPVMASLISNTGLNELLAATEAPIPQLTEGKDKVNFDHMMNDQKKEGDDGKNDS